MVTVVIGTVYALKIQLAKIQTYIIPTPVLFSVLLFF